LLDTQRPEQFDVRGRPAETYAADPLDSLDVPSQAGISALIQRVCREQGVAVLLVAHDVNPILTYLDKVV
jgi:zinc/manganese transport system ATP-binding protein